MSAANLRSSKRRRRRPPYYHASTAAEERHLQHAIQNSKLDRGRPADGRLNVPLAPTFFPTVEDFEGNPISYIEKIRPVAERFGVCKIVPPKGWNPAPFGTWDRMRTLSRLWRIVRSNLHQKGGSLVAVTAVATSLGVTRSLYEHRCSFDHRHPRVRMCMRLWH
jgi:jmjN domain